MFKFGKKRRDLYRDENCDHTMHDVIRTDEIISISNTEGMRMPTSQPEVLDLVLPHRHGKIGMRLAVMLDQVVVMIVDESGTAWNAGLREGDMLLKVNTEEVEADVVKVVTLIKLGSFPMKLEIVRNGRLEGRVLNNRLTVFNNQGLAGNSGDSSEGERISIPFSWLKKLCHRLPPVSGSTFTDVPLKEIRELSTAYRRQENGENCVSVESGVLKIARDDIGSNRHSEGITNRYRETGIVDIDKCPVEEEIGMHGELRGLLATGDISQEKYERTIRQFELLGIGNEGGGAVGSEGNRHTTRSEPAQIAEPTAMGPPVIAGPPVYDPAEDAEDEPTEDAVYEPTEDAVHEPTEDAVHEPTEDAVYEPTEDAVHEPTEDAVHEPTEDAEDEPAIEADELELLSEEELREYLEEMLVAHDDCSTKEELVLKLHAVLREEEEAEREEASAGPVAGWHQPATCTAPADWRHQLAYEDESSDDEMV
jgi:hypothetical protein